MNRFDIQKLRGSLETDSQRAIFDQLAGTPFGREIAAGTERADSQTLSYAARQLEHVYAKAYEEEFADLRMANGEIVQIDSSVNEGARSFVYYLYSSAGVARFQSGYSTDLPTVHSAGAQVHGNVEVMENAYEYSRQDLRSARMAGDNLDARLAKAARRAHDELLNKVGCWGREDIGLPGLFNHPNITVTKSPANGTGSSRNWADKTNDLILDDIATLIDTVDELTFGKRQVNKVLFSRAVANLLKRRRIADGAGDGFLTLWKFLEGHYGGVSFEVMNELGANNSDGNLSEDAAFGYVSGDIDLVSLVVPMAFVQHAVQEVDNKIKVPCESSTGGIKLPEPMICNRMDNVGPAS